MKRFRLALTIFSLISAISYAICWYQDTPIPAWQAFVWCWFVFWHDLDEYSRTN